MSAGTVILLRHGRTEYNATGRLQGQVDIPLDDVGLWQAQHGGAALAARVRPAKVVSSDLLRAQATAQVFADLTGHTVTQDERLRERNFGQWEGMTIADLTARWPEQYAAFRTGADPKGLGGESRTEVGQRMAEAITEHAADLGPQDTLVVVTHGAAIALAITALLEIDPTTWKGIQGVANVHWSTLRASGPAAEPAWRLSGHNVGPDFALEHWNAGPDWQLEPSSV